METNECDVMQLQSLYQNCSAFHGELHDHSASGGTSDGKRPLMHWLGAMEALGMDFAAILDHKQVRHMYLPEWEDGVFIAGTEPGAVISDSLAEEPRIHYNMLFEAPTQLEDLLEEFPEFEFTGGQEGHFEYPPFTGDRMRELIDAVKARGGLWVHPHPKQKMISDDPMEYWFADETGIEVFYRDFRHPYTEENYALWTTLLSMGKRLWACAGCDMHACAHDTALTTVYATERKNAAYFTRLRRGDFTCGAVGIQMCIGDTPMGGRCDFAGKRLVLSVGDFHRSVKNELHQYRVDLLNDRGLVCSQEISCAETAYLAIDAEDCKFYRAEVFDTTENLRIAIGNPIWNL